MTIAPRRLFWNHVAVIAGFLVINVLIGLVDAAGITRLFGFSRLMRLEHEASVPTVFSAAALVAAAVVAQAIHAHLTAAEPDRAAWSILAALFTFLALDEILQLHELANWIGRALSLDGLLQNVGVLLYVPAVAFLAGWMFPFWRRQQPAIRLLLLAGGVIYVASAVGVELFENHLRSRGYTDVDAPLRASFIIEEGGEMLGVAILLRAFLQRFAALGCGILFPLVVADSRNSSPRPQKLPPNHQKTAVSSRP